MKPQLKYHRRAFLASTAGAGAALVAVASTGCADSKNDRRLQFASLAEAMIELAQLAKASELASGTAWDWPQTLVHCAQSIEYSMTGFPQAKSALFQRTAGTVAYSVFAWRGRMTHDLADPIPGAPALQRNGDAAAALARLQGAVQAFQQWAEPLQPHFAYGALSKGEYEPAHAMHLANHFSAFRAMITSAQGRQERR